jgi:hypothetical protein
MVLASWKHTEALSSASIRTPALAWLRFLGANEHTHVQVTARLQYSDSNIVVDSGIAGF